MSSGGSSGTSTASSDELAVAAAVEAMSVANGPIDLIEPQRPPGVGEAPDVQPTSFQVVEPHGIPATASLPPQDIGSDPGDVISLDIPLKPQPPGEYTHPFCQETSFGKLRDLRSRYQ